MQDYQTLIAEHDHMDMLAARLSNIAGGCIDVVGALQARSALSMALEDHLSREKGFLYDGLIRDRAKDFTAAVVAFHDSFADLVEDWGEYLRGWDAECIAIDWPMFGEETVTMMERLRARIAEENGLLYPLALRHSCIRLRAAA